jgi:Uma2 family endonuclease
MGIPQPSLTFNFDDYLAFESAQVEKHDYVRGEIFAMAGARRAHVTVSLNLAIAFKTHLRGTPCRTYMADMKLRVEAADCSFYPDVMVSGDARDSTAAYDRGNKFADYRKLPSLQDYVVVDIDSRRVECFRRNADKHWVLYDVEGDGECEFASIGFSMPLAAVFEDVEAESPTSSQSAPME